MQKVQTKSDLTPTRDVAKELNNLKEIDENFKNLNEITIQKHIVDLSIKELRQ